MPISSSAALPVAEAAGVKLALHPDDPPVPMLGGVARLFHDPAGFQARLGDECGAVPAWGLDLCLGCCSEMPGGARHRARDDRVLRAERAASSTSISATCKGTVPAFTECFIGEGNYDPAEAMALLKKQRLRPASCSTITCRTWTATRTGTIAGARMRSATCKGCCGWVNLRCGTRRDGIVSRESRQASVANSPAMRRPRLARLSTSMNSPSVCIASPIAPRPSRVAMPIAPVKLPSEPPPALCGGMS